MPDLHTSFEGVLLGTAVGDAIGLPREGLSARRAQRLFGSPPYEYALLPRWGLVSDDTEHACMVAQSLLESGLDPNPFAESLARHLRWWFACMPAGIGLATLKSCLRLWLGFSPNRSGVHSAGNGPAMRSALIGVIRRDDPSRMRDLVTASSKLTHTDPRAIEGAYAIALAAGLASQSDPKLLDPSHVIDHILSRISNEELTSRLHCCREQLIAGASPTQFVQAMGLTKGVTGYICHTVPAAIFCFLRYPADFRQAVESAISLGGDSDTVGAITGAIAGAAMGSDAIPPSWLTHLRDWPWSVTRMCELAHRLADQQRGNAAIPVRYASPLVPLRNAAFAAVVIAHGLRRLLPPY